MTKKVLFYEDMKELNADEVENQMNLRKEVAEKETKFYYERRETIEANKAPNILRLELIPYIQYKLLQVEAETLPELETLLKSEGYEFRHRTEEEWTEQLSARIIKRLNPSGQIDYLFLDIKISLGYEKRNLV